jgi:hypothetical protein
MTKSQIIAQLKKEYKTLTKQVNDEIVELDQDEYEATIDSWADVQLEKIAKQAEADAKAQAKAAAQEKLAALGLTVEDLQALGL